MKEGRSPLGGRPFCTRPSIERIACASVGIGLERLAWRYFLHWGMSALCAPNAACPPVFPTKEPGLGAKRLRSEEHTSELQSPCNLVCRLLLEKKNYTHTHQNLARDAIPPTNLRTPTPIGVCRGASCPPTLRSGSSRVYQDFCRIRALRHSNHI